MRKNCGLKKMQMQTASYANNGHHFDSNDINGYEQL